MTAADGSRSSSPATPETHYGTLPKVDLSAWCHSFSPDTDPTWDALHGGLTDIKTDEEGMLMLDDIICESSYDPVPTGSPTSINPAVLQNLHEQKSGLNASADVNVSTSSDNSSCEGHPVPDMVMGFVPKVALITKAVPPPPTQTRRYDALSGSRKVVYPEKETCNNLTIITPNIPATGTKSRVETQVRVQLDLAHTIGSLGNPLDYEKVGSWKWLRLPKGTATRKRSRKEGKLEASPADSLYLNTMITCSTPPHTQVVTCSTCQRREAKRVARKVAARIRPTKSDSDTNDGPAIQDQDDNVGIIQFNCPEALDFTSGSATLPLRITCYCRHHREKQGFNVHFTMTDDSGRIVGKGMSPPIMITDDHKSTGIHTAKPSRVGSCGVMDGEWEARPVAISGIEAVNVETGAPSKRRQAAKQSSGQYRKRAKPYENGRPSKHDHHKEYNHPNSGSASGMQHLELAPNSIYGSAPPSICSGTAPPSPQARGAIIAEPPSPPISFASPSNSQSSHFDNDITMCEHGGFLYPPSPPRTAPSSPHTNSVISSSSTPLQADFSSIALSILNPQPVPSLSSLPPSKIHRLIPSAGPTFGGIEVTVLGSNFHPSVLYNCVFGDVIASSTSRWSDNTLVCILPPRSCPGVVPVTLEGIKMEEDATTTPVHFTYTDESDRALMELALQVVGLKMTGKIEDAKNVAMRIVGSSNQDQTPDVDISQAMSVAGTSASVDPRRLLLSGASDGDFEKLIVDFLSLLDVPVDNKDSISLSASISHQTSSGQTLLHLATFLKFSSLAEFLVQHEIDVDARDNNGYTALHCAALIGSHSCTRVLLDARVDIDIVDALGRTAAELSPPGFFQSMWRGVDYDSLSEDEAEWGDAEEDSEDGQVAVFRPQSHGLTRRRVRRPTSRWPSKPPSLVASDDEENVVQPEEDGDDDDTATVVSPDSLVHDSAKDDMDEKQAAASFAEYFQRAWAQFQPPHIVPQMPQMPQMPQLPGVPAWVFPVFVPMPAWPAFRGEKRTDDTQGAEGKGGDGEFRSSHTEWRASWEKWMAQMMTASANGRREPPVAQPDVPSATDAGAGEPPASSSQTNSPVVPVPTASRSLLRRFGYGAVQMTDQELNAFTHRPKRTRKLMKKEDRMLVLFWIPILILAIGWALYTSLPLAFSALKDLLPLTESLGALGVIN